MLLHDFVDGGSVAVVHFVEFVDAADAVVGEDKGTAFKDHLVGDRVAHYGCCEAYTAAASSGGVDASGSDFRNVFQELGFCNAGVAHQADVDISSYSHPVAHFFGHAADEEEEQGFLDVEVAVDFRGDGPGEVFVHVA